MTMTDVALVSRDRTVSLPRPSTNFGRVGGDEGIEPLTHNHWNTSTLFRAPVAVGTPNCNSVTLIIPQEKVRPHCRAAASVPCFAHD